jgi:hypothetical protein
MSVPSEHLSDAGHCDPLKERIHFRQQSHQGLLQGAACSLDASIEFRLSHFHLRVSEQFQLPVQ